MISFKSETKTVITWPTANLLLGALGISIVWLSTHNWIAIVGTVIAAVHVQLVVTSRPKE